VRAGLSTTAKIETAQKKNVLTIPIQALAERTQEELDDAANSKDANVTLAASKTSTSSAAKTSIQGAFIVRRDKAQFVRVQTGITGVSDIEVTGGLQEGDEIVTGSYKALRTLKPGAAIKIDNNAAKTEETSS